MSRVEAYITVHDQDLLLECERTQQFAQLSSYTYLFVGHRPVDRVPDHVKIIVCRDYEPNIEHWPQLYDFTGWYVLAKHRLIKAQYVICLQYDMHIIHPRLEQRCADWLWDSPGIIAFTAGHRLAGNFMLNIAGFEALYSAGLSLKHMNMDTWPDFNEWPSTQGAAWRWNVLIEYMEWLEPMFELFAPNVWAGHLLERTVKAYSVRTTPEQYMPNVINHKALDCHGTGALMAGNRATYESRNAEFMHRYQSS